MAELHRAVRRLHEYGRRYPSAWETYAFMIAEPPAPWPAWCWCPLAAAYAIISGGGSNRVPLDRSNDIGILGALAAWRGTQGIYRFHPTLVKELYSTPLDGKLPTSVLEHLPEWCVYVDLEGTGHSAYGRPLAGFWAYLEYDVNAGRGELRLVFDFTDDRLPALGQGIIHLGGTLEEGLLAMVKEARIQALRVGAGDNPSIPKAEYAEVWAEDLRGLVSLVLYLCADEAEIEARGPLPPKVVRGKKRPILPAAKAPVIHETGARLGARLDLARQRHASSDEGTGASVRPHVRRAHWHHYWTGPRTASDRRLVLRWLSPILVALDDVPDEAVVRPVNP